MSMSKKPHPVGCILPCEFHVTFKNEYIHMNKTTAALLAFISGASVGSLFGILYAPDAGINTRDRITYRLDKTKEKLEDLLAELMKGKDMPPSTARSEGQKVISDAKEKAERLLNDVEELIGQIKGKK